MMVKYSELMTIDQLATKFGHSLAEFKRLRLDDIIRITRFTPKTEYLLNKDVNSIADFHVAERRITQIFFLVE